MIGAAAGIAIFALSVLPFPTVPSDRSGGGGGGDPAYEPTATVASTTGAGTISVPYPTGTSEGDFVFCSLAVDGNNRLSDPTQGVTDDQAVPPAWSRVQYPTGAGKTGAFFHRRVGAGEITTGNITATHGTDDVIFGCGRVSGATTAVASSSSTFGASPATFSSVATTGPSVVIAMAVYDDNTGWTSPPAGYTEIIAQTAGSTVGLNVAYLETATTGSITPGDAVIASSTDGFGIVVGFE